MTFEWNNISSILKYMKLHEQLSEKDHFTASFKSDLYLLSWFITTSCQLIRLAFNMNSKYPSKHPSCNVVYRYNTLYTADATEYVTVQIDATFHEGRVKWRAVS